MFIKKVFYGKKRRKREDEKIKKNCFKAQPEKL